MTDINALQDAFMKADALAQQGNAQAAEDARVFAAEIRRLQSGGQEQAADRNEGVLGQVNRGIADVVDVVRAPVRALDSAVEFVTGVDPVPDQMDADTAEIMRQFGVMAARNDPETFMQAVGRGAGLAAGSAPLAALGAAGLGMSSGPVVGPIGQGMAQSLRTIPGFATEVAAGAAAEGAAELTEQAGGGELAQNLARIGAPASIPLAGAGISTAGRVAQNMPVAGYVVNMGRQAAGSLAPATPTGARQVAREELLRRAGSEQRLQELGGQINPNDPYNRTGAQQIGDPEFLGLEEAVKDEFPTVREDLNARADGSRQALREDFQGDGRTAEAQEFFNARMGEVRQNMQARVDRVLSSADAPQARRGEADNSARVVDGLKAELDDALQQERQMWAAIPQDVTVSLAQTKTTAARLLQETPRAQQADFPQIANRLLIEDGGLGDQERVSELLGLYSELRRVARSAMAGNDQNKNRARLANAMADAILDDLDAAGGEVARVTADARAFSRTLHETFDQGAVGRILKRTLDGDETMTNEAALRQTVRPGPEGGQAASRIENAAPGVRENIEDFLTDRFSQQLFSPDGAFQPRQAARWLRDNADALSRYPGLRSRLQGALGSQKKADSFKARAALREKALSDLPVAKYAGEKPENAVATILKAKDPTKAAKSVVATAKRDPSGRALEGVKASLTDRLISEATNADGVLSGRGLVNLMNDPDMKRALQAVFSARELGGLQRIAQAAAKMDVKPSGGEEIINAPVNALLMRVVQIAAAQQGGRMGAASNMGGSLQTANILSTAARRMLNNLQNKKARELLVEAVQDPKLMRAIMLHASADTPKWAADRVTPYLAGGAATLEQD